MIMGETSKDVITGGCHCGAIQYHMPSTPAHHAVCHCTDCRRHAGAPMVNWALVSSNDIQIKGSPKLYASSENGRRHFCGDCGTGLFYTNDQIFPGMIDVQASTLHDPSAILPVQCQIQTAERMDWVRDLADLPSFERYPPME
jgi:hypothetical protein